MTMCYTENTLVLHIRPSTCRFWCPNHWKANSHHLHDDPAAGHLGLEKTISRVQQRFHWVNYRNLIELWIKSCVPCQARKNPPKPTRAAKKQFPAGHPNQRIGIDFLGLVRRSDSGNAYVLVIAYYFIKCTEAFATADMCMETVADILVNQYMARFGIVREKISDKYLQLVMLAYRSSVQESTGFSPACLTFGREIELPCDLLYGGGPSETCSGHVAYVQKLITEMDIIHHLSRDKMQQASNRQKRLLVPVTVTSLRH